MKRVFGWLFILIPISAFSQAPNQELYQYNYAIINPALAGIEGTRVTASGNAFVVKDSVANHLSIKTYYSATAAFETQLKKINCGTGLIANVFDGGYDKTITINVPINYQWKIGEDRKFVFGVKLGYERIQVPNPIEHGPYIWVPYDTSTMITRSGFIGGGGVMYRGPKFYAGFSADNLVFSKQLDLYSLEQNELYEPIARRFHTMIGWSLPWNGKVTTDHSIFLTSSKYETLTMDVNNYVIIRKLVIAGFTLGIEDDSFLPKVNAGLQLKDVGRLVVMVYSKSYGDPSIGFHGQMFLQVNINGQKKV